MTLGMKGASKFRIVMLIEPTQEMTCLPNVNFIFWIYQNIDEIRHDWDEKKFNRRARIRQLTEATEE